jgi:hypothetical protein
MASKLSDNVVISPEMDYHPVDFRHPTYKFQKIPLQAGGTSINPLYATQGVESIWELPIKAFSLPESYITGTFTPGASTHFNFLFEHVPFISEIQLMSTSGRKLCDISNQALINYQAVTRPPNTPLEEFMTTDPTERLYPIKSIGAAAETAATGSGFRMNDTAADRPYTDIRFLKVGVDTTATPIVNFVFKLGQIKDTIFSMKKAMLFPETVLLRVLWGPAQKFMCNSTAETAVITGAAVPTDGRIDNLSFYLACETNQEIVNTLQAQIASTGIQLPIPYVTVVKSAPNAAVSQTVQVKIAAPIHGLKIKKIIHAVFNATENKDTAVDHNNLIGAKVLNYVTSLDSNQLQINKLDCQTMFDDYAYHKSMLRGTVLQTRNMYQYNWFHCDDFSGLTVDSKKSLPVPAENAISGLDVGGGRIWTFDATTAGAQYAHYTFIVGYKTLVITGNSIDVL